MTLSRKTFKTWTSADMKKACKFCLVTSPSWLDKQTLGDCVADAIIGGATMVQLRIKNAIKFELAKAARDLAPICRISNVPLVINDDIEVVKSTGADGLHIADSNISCKDARRLLGDSTIIGVSVNNAHDALRAQEEGATYVSVGPLDATSSDPSCTTVPKAILTDIATSLSIPTIAYGGLNSSNIKDLSDTSISGVAVMSAILSATDIEEAAKALSCELQSVLA